MTATTYAAAAMIAVRGEGSRRPPRAAAGCGEACLRAVSLREVPVRTAMSGCLLTVPPVQPKEHQDDHHDQGEVDDGHRRRLPHEGPLQVVHEHGGGAGLVAGAAPRHLPDDRERVEYVHQVD